MPQDVSIVSDLKTAAVLAGSAGLLSAVTVPFLLPSIVELVPPEQRTTLPLPLPLFCVVLAAQFLIVYGLFALAGAQPRAGSPAHCHLDKEAPRPLRLAGSPGIRDGRSLWDHPRRHDHVDQACFATNAPGRLHPSSLWGALLASATASVSEEILCRLFLLSVLLRVLPMSEKSVVLAVVVSSLLFGALHVPAAAFIFGGIVRPYTDSTERAPLARVSPLAGCRSRRLSNAPFRVVLETFQYPLLRTFGLALLQMYLLHMSSK
jgi:hypothetical protein